MALTRNMAPETAQAYRILCEFCALPLCENPSDQVLDRLIEQRDLLCDEPFASVAPEPALELHALLEQAAAGAADEVKAAIRRDYAYLFLMVGTSGTSPFESVYRTDDRTMFGPTTLEVREAYRAWDVQVPGFGSVPDDHLGFELLFLAYLLGAAQEDEVAQVERALDDVVAFLSDHVLVFAPTYLHNVGVRAKEPFYRALAAVAAATIASMAANLETKASDRIDEVAYILPE